jgi:hypothetical protein
LEERRGRGLREGIAIHEHIISKANALAGHDTVIGAFNTNIMDPMKAYCRKLTITTIAAGHWVALEAPAETNAAILRWIAKELPEDRAWPFGKLNPLKKNE